MAKQPLDTVSARILWVERITGLPRTALSRLAGLSEGHVGLLARGAFEPSPRTANKLAKAFGFSTAWLLFGEGRRPSPDRVRDIVNAAYRAHKARARQERARAEVQS